MEVFTVLWNINEENDEESLKKTTLSSHEKEVEETKIKSTQERRKSSWNIHEAVKNCEEIFRHFAHKS